eukprot:TRINITY_DN2432_c0_g1_i4.p1 TRINITY_DN2432_c0_g1~~TRINITY_DN2432_c0_g1_i4.p1  ORF type:complete len:218 (+),score=-30.61 TRINITY_DN2432_c0_g1_i4:214-867(+)
MIMCQSLFKPHLFRFSQIKLKYSQHEYIQLFAYTHTTIYPLQITHLNIFKTQICKSNYNQATIYQTSKTKNQKLTQKLIMTNRRRTNELIIRSKQVAHQNNQKQKQLSVTTIQLTRLFYLSPTTLRIKMFISLLQTSTLISQLQKPTFQRRSLQNKQQVGLLSSKNSIYLRSYIFTYRNQYTIKITNTILTNSTSCDIHIHLFRIMHIILICCLPNV